MRPFFADGGVFRYHVGPFTDRSGRATCAAARIRPPSHPSVAPCMLPLVALVGRPNVGKSTLFNALTETAAAQAANYPFCTIEPNIGNVAVPDDRLEKLAAIATSKKIIATQLAFVDIAGLVRGASKGEGLGNQFLANIRETDAIVHVLRCFEDGDITHAEAASPRSPVAGPSRPS